IKRTDERFECIGQCGCTLPAATGFLPAPHQNVTAQIKSTRMRLQRIARNQPCTQFRELPFCFDLEIAEQIFSDDELEHRIAKELQPLIIKVITLRFVPQARMRECFSQQKRVAKLIADKFL